LKKQASTDIVLASASPRRAELLRSAGFSFTVRPADIDETGFPGEPPADYVLRIARAKARAAAAWPRNRALILAADTTVVAAGETLGKPADDRDAARMLTILSGKVHIVLTGVVVLSDNEEVAEVVSTRVSVRPLSPDEIGWYVGTREPEGKAGAYAIQGIGARFVDWIDGSWSNVVGLPVATVDRLIKRLQP
jgi:septum formation protein